MYDILGKPQGEPQVSETVYQTDKYLVKVEPPCSINGRGGYYSSMGVIGSADILACGYDDTQQDAYNVMLAEFGELRNKYK